MGNGRERGGGGRGWERRTRSQSDIGSVIAMRSISALGGGMFDEGAGCEGG